MSPDRRSRTLALMAGLMLAKLAACGDSPAHPVAAARTLSPAQSAALVARGGYLTKAADCEACHTAVGGRPFAGGLAFAFLFGKLYSPNITPDAATGIGGYSDADWVRVMHKGINRHGMHLYPAMPYTSYTEMSDDDAIAIKAYLMSLPPVSAKRPASTIKFPFTQRWAIYFWNLINNPDTRFRPDTARSANYNRGAYLVRNLGHCGECHTPRNFMMAVKSDRQLSGATEDGWVAYNLTGDKATGLGGWSDAELAQYLTTGHAAGRGPASGPMAEVIEDSLQYMTAQDIAAIVTYLRGVPARANGPAAVQRDGKPMAGHDPPGARLFADACQGCHLPNGEGRQSPWAALRGDHSAGDPAGTNVVQILSKGTQIKTATGVMFMHPYTLGYTRNELAALSNYTIGQFGLRQGQITPGQFPVPPPAPH